MQIVLLVIIKQIMTNDRVYNTNALISERFQGGCPTRESTIAKNWNWREQCLAISYSLNAALINRYDVDDVVARRLSPRRSRWLLVHDATRKSTTNKGQRLATVTIWNCERHIKIDSALSYSVMTTNLRSTVFDSSWGDFTASINQQISVLCHVECWIPSVTSLEAYWPYVLDGWSVD